jgi:hypothetical protein
MVVVAAEEGDEDVVAADADADEEAKEKAWTNCGGTSTGADGRGDGDVLKTDALMGVEGRGVADALERDASWSPEMMRSRDS